MRQDALVARIQQNPESIAEMGKSPQNRFFLKVKLVCQEILRSFQVFQRRSAGDGASDAKITEGEPAAADATAGPMLATQINEEVMATVLRKQMQMQLLVRC